MEGVDGSGIQRHIRVKKLKERAGIGVVSDACACFCWLLLVDLVEDQMDARVQKEWEQNSVRYEEVLQQLTEVRSETTSDKGMKKRRMVSEVSIVTCIAEKCDVS